MTTIKTIPMSTEEIQELFMNQDKTYKIDLQNSRLQGEAFITYIANMQISCELPLDVKVDTDKKLEVLKYFFSFRQTVNCQQLVETMGYILLYTKGISFNFDTCWLTEDEINTFINQNEEVISKTSIFLESTLLFVPAFNTNFKKLVLEPAIESGEVVEIRNPDFIGVNVLGLYTLSSFIEFYLSVPPSIDLPQVYFKDQVENLYYNKMPLFEIIMKQGEESFLMSLVNVIFSQEEEEKKAFQKFVDSHDSSL